MAEFLRVGARTDFPEGRGRAVSVAGSRVAVFHVGGCWYALQDACPHMGASLAEGSVRERRVTCAWHARSFDLATGESDARAGGCARTYEIRVEGDDVLVRPAGADRAAAAERPDDAGDPGADDDWIAFDPERHLRKR